MEKHLAAILYADVVGYSRLTGSDEEKTHQKLDTALDVFSEIIRLHRGTKVHEAGDAILAEFHSITAAVSAAADSATRALRAFSERREASSFCARVSAFSRRAALFPPDSVRAISEAASLPLRRAISS